MTNEEFIDAVKNGLKPVQQKYIDKGRVSPGGTITAMKNRLEQCLEDIDELERDMLEVINNLKNENNLEVTDELMNEIKAESMNVLRSITNYRILGTLPQ